MRPILAYASPVWGYAAKTNINKLDTLQNSLIPLPTGLAPPHLLNPSPEGSQSESTITLPASNREQPLSSQPCQKTLNISHPDEARSPRLPDSIDQPITAMPLSRMLNPTFAKPHIQVITRDRGLCYSPDARKSIV
ncbi:hypothetical protein TNCV_230701 [Trichonephila clavipes]|nr:hypothetical protein TNCV_230701 [Trichonephila clavipes]